MKTIKTASFAAALCGMCLAFAPVDDAQAAVYRLAVEPSYSAELADDVYRPLLEYLNRTTGHRFELVTTRSYHTYWRELRDRTPVDFAFDEPHFVDYRIQHMGFVPIARTAEPTVYVLLAQPNYEGENLRSLIGRPAICMPAPSLGFALLAEMYGDNPVASPDIRSEAPTWLASVQMVFSGEAASAMVPSYVADEYHNLPKLARTDPLPGRAFTASPTVPPEDVAVVARALANLHEDPALFTVLDELGATRFLPTTADEYAGYEKILRSFHGYRSIDYTVKIENEEEDTGLALNAEP